MAYMRGDTYIWNDEDNLHVWAADGYDGWDDTIWACEEDGKRRVGFEEASGVSISMDVMDEYVMMRLAQLLYEGKVTEATDRAVSHNGNTGVCMLVKNAEILKSALNAIRLECAEPYCWKKPKQVIEGENG